MQQADRGRNMARLTTLDRPVLTIVGLKQA